MSITLRPYQKECVNILNKQTSGAHLVKMATGLGKCFVFGTKIRMYDYRVKPVQCIKEGELVMGYDGKPRRVVGVATGEDTMYEIKQEYGRNYTVNSEHILSLVVKLPDHIKYIIDNKGNKYFNYTVCNIPVKDYTKCNEEFKKYSFGWNSAAIELPFSPVIISPYEFGYNLYKKNHKISYFKTYSLTHPNIPKRYLCNTIENRTKLLSGIVDNPIFNANISLDRIILKIPYSKLAKQIVKLALSLGISAKYIYTVNNTEVWLKDVVYNKIQKTFSNTEPITLKKIQVIKKNRDKYYGFELTDGIGRMFLLDDFTVVHNTVVFSNIERRGKMLILAHREELINQAAKYFNCPVGIEMAEQKSNGEPIVIASVLSLINRLERFSKDEFDIICIDEAHHCITSSYQKILNYFNPRVTFGFTATPRRGDNQGLEQVFDDIIFQRDIKWGIQNGYLCPVYCLRHNIGYDISKVKKRLGDFSQKELEQTLNTKKINKEVANAYKTKAKGQTLIFATSIKHAKGISKEIPGSYVITMDTKDRANILDKFRTGKIKCIVSVNIFIEGTDLPNVETVIMARPTPSANLYCQAVGRGLRTYPNKEYLTLVDCVGYNGRHNVCSAPTLVGLSTDLVPADRMPNIEGDLLEIERRIKIESDVPESWIKNAKIVNKWAKKYGYNLMDINWYRMPDGSINCRIPKEDDGSSIKQQEQEIITISAPDELGNCVIFSKEMHIQDAIKYVYDYLNEYKKYCEPIWNLKIVRNWGEGKATDKQIRLIKYKLPSFNLKNITKQQASDIINRLSNGYMPPKDNNWYETEKQKISTVEKTVNNIILKPEKALDKKLKNFTVVRIFTTGKDMITDEIYRISALKYRQGEIYECFDTFVYSYSNSVREIYKYYNISNIEALPRIESVIQALQKYISNDNLVMYRAKFTLDFLIYHGLDIEKIHKVSDTYSIVRLVKPELKGYSMSALVSTLNLQTNYADNGLQKAAYIGELYKYISSQR